MASSFESGSSCSLAACAAHADPGVGRICAAVSDHNHSCAKALDEAEARLWQRHASRPNAALREALILHHLPYARTVAAGMYGRHLHQEVAFEDVLQWAIVGMIEAIDRYDPGNRAGRASRASFRTYALPRMRGAILDGLGQFSERQRQTALQRRLKEQGLPRPAGKPCNEHLMRLLLQQAGTGMGIALRTLLADTGMIAPGETAYADPSSAALETRQQAAFVRQTLRGLTPRESAVMNLHYLQGMRFHDIARMLSISNGRVSQLHTLAIARLRKALDGAA
ncbi:sigma-70 family RNA polymerase sigma factor [Noviherbaspirillum pedocola]|uniref:Sigma-70 family RNA polymerase sigma factor n=1 Tax=Noviherbaspirillum pedocola TaxID=2801341 RepID=A0A934T3Q4_9BURK|nr:sigma-70 family RNA polymerase sigma factor [Noviherbaspirillum pedocola]MBK4738023.1 sigma-70 family RNA polymerase sigma factor [Noviherbaspirillum pedocola]